MPKARAGQNLTCPHCNESFYRRPSHVRRGITKTCGKRECISLSMQGEGNPFWGKTHSEETREALAKNPTAKPPGAKRTGPPKGYKHTPEARAKMSAALKARWQTNRDKMLGYTKRSDRPREELRYRRNFSPWQRENWKEPKCVWCDAPDDLVLDHIIPVMCGGQNARENAQTLCQPCNIWKMRYVDRPLLLAGLVDRGSRI